MFREGVLVAMMCVAAGALAQTPADVERARQQADQIQQRERELERQRREAEEARRRTPSGQALKPRPLPDPAPAGAACRTITEIVLEGASRLDAADQARLAAPFLGRCLGLDDINRLLAAITNRYVELGYVTTRVYIPQQDLGGGRLLLRILEGRAQSFSIDPADSASAATAFPGLAGEVLNLRDIEQGLDQINRLASNAARIEIEPGDEAGRSRVVIRNPARRRWLVSAGVDNSGSVATGRTLATGLASVDHLLGLNDYLNASVRGSRKSRGEFTEGGGVYAAVPWGYWTFSASANVFRYASKVQGAVSTFDTDGRSDSQMLRADRVVYRDQAVKWSLGGGLTLKQTENRIAATRIDAGSADLAVMDLGSNLSIAAAGAILSFDASLASGIDALGATRDDPAQPPGAPQAEFTKLNFGASLMRPFKAWGESAYFQGRLAAQKSNHFLYGTEQFSIGNLYTVRGFETTSLSGRTGHYVRTDLGLQLPVAAGQLRPYVGFDFGHVEGAGSLQGAALGLDVSLGGATLQFSYASPVSVPDGLAKEGGWLYVRLAYAL
jgi:hemolysin activation/secretion protein